jgi:hypothetical protein
MNEIVFLLEEESAKAMIEIILPRIADPDWKSRYIVFEGKSDLKKQMVRKLKGYRNPNAKFVILQDQDSADCMLLKKDLMMKCREAGKPEVKVRIACRELESWYLSDLSAVEMAFSRKKLSQRQTEKKFRNTDLLGSPSRELKILVPEYQKVSGSREIARHLNIENSRSQSFNHFIKAIKQIIQIRPGSEP